MDENKLGIRGIDWKIGVIFLLLIIIIIEYPFTIKITRDRTINEIYDYIDVQYRMCANSCGALSEPAWINIRQGIAECTCLNIINNGNQTNNQLSVGDN